jgi:hypothetical protein
MPHPVDGSCAHGATGNAAAASRRPLPSKGWRMLSALSGRSSTRARHHWQRLARQQPCFLAQRRKARVALVGRVINGSLSRLLIKTRAC